jgi:hypothetical protein
MWVRSANAAAAVGPTRASAGAETILAVAETRITGQDDLAIASGITERIAASAAASDNEERGRRVIEGNERAAAAAAAADTCVAVPTRTAHDNLQHLAGAERNFAAENGAVAARSATVAAVAALGTGNGDVIEARGLDRESLNVPRECEHVCPRRTHAAEQQS